MTAAAASADIPDDLRFSLTDAPGRDSYPICGAVWAVLAADRQDAKGREVRDFLRWATHEGQDLAAPLHYARLPQSLVDRLDHQLSDP